MTAKEVESRLQGHANVEDAKIMGRFFKTGPGQYGEGDVFIGAHVPEIRKISKHYALLPLSEVQKLLDSQIHEYRLAAVLILTYQYPKANSEGKRAIYELYLKNARDERINNWDIIDLSAKDILGQFLWENGMPHDVLFELAQNRSIWQRRISILASFYFLYKGDATTTLQLSEMLLDDKEDLIQKAVGWMLREVGKRVDRALLLAFLDKHAATMPRMALRYAIEHLSPEQRLVYMQLKSKLLSGPRLSEAN